MQQASDNTAARERVLDAAEKLFGQRGYTAVTLRDIAAAIGIKHTSLYHHVPGGKEQLFVEVTERNLKRHHRGLTQAMEHAAPDIRSRLCSAADWLLSQPPMDLVRMSHSDMPTIDPTQARRLSWLAYQSILMPLEHTLQHAQQQGEINHHNLGLIAGGILGVVDGLHAVPEADLEQPRREMAYELIDALLNGIRRR